MVVEERAPRLRWRSPAAHHVFAHTRFADIDPQFQQFTMDLRSSPNRILAADRANQLMYVLRTRSPPWLPTTDLPGPEQAESLAMPTDHRRCLHDDRPGFPVLPGEAGRPSDGMAFSAAGADFTHVGKRKKRDIAPRPFHE